MFASARVRTIVLAGSVASALTTAPAMAQAPADQDLGVPLTPPPLESPNPGDENPPSAQSPGSAGVALLTALVGPLGLALGGTTTAAAASTGAVPTFTPTPRLHPSAPSVGRGSTGASE